MAVRIEPLPAPPRPPKPPLVLKPSMGRTAASRFLRQGLLPKGKPQ